VYSQTYDLNIHLKNGNTVTVSIEDIQTLQFANVTGIEASEEIQNVIQSFKLKQNYPNPFNPTTTIEYELPENSDVIVSIYDINGRLIKEVLNNVQSEGVHKVTWDGTNQNNTPVASGIYVYTVRFAEQLHSRQMVLLK
jgi:flagellar hook assembly protein FlgD